MTVAEQRVVAVVVTHRRPDTLRRSLDAVAAQSRPVDQIVVVDNGDDDATRAVVAATGAPTV